jgi:hypothetical protein
VCVRTHACVCAHECALSVCAVSVCVCAHVCAVSVFVCVCVHVHICVRTLVKSLVLKKKSDVSVRENGGVV